MKCPICFEGIHEPWRGVGQKILVEDCAYRILKMDCSKCGNDLLQFTKYKDNIKYKDSNNIMYVDSEEKNEFVIPLTKKLESLSDFIPEEYVEHMRNSILSWILVPEQVQH